MADIRVDFKKMQQLEKQLEVQLDNASVEVANTIKSVAISKVLKDTGDTAGSIKVRKSKYEGGGAALVAGEKTILVKGRQVSLAFLLEYGKKFKPAKPFMRPALLIGRRMSKSIYGKHIKKVLG